MKSAIILAAIAAPFTAFAATVTLYDNINYDTQGKMATVASNNNCAAIPKEMNDKTSSFIISPGNVECHFWDSALCPSNEAYLTWNGGNSWVGDRWNDRISSFICFG